MIDIALVLLMIVIGVVLAIVIARWQFKFKRELRYLAIEIERTEGKEREYWIHRKRKLWMSLIPFVRY